MQLTDKQASSLLALISCMTVRDLRDCDALSAVAVLEDIAGSGSVGLYIVVAQDNSEKVKGIKTLRERTGMGLKEAKDLYEELEQEGSREINSRNMSLGPFQHVPREVAEEIQRATANHFDRAPVIWKR